jgi:hypothetical protein
VALNDADYDEDEIERRAKAMRNNIHEHRFLGVLVSKNATIADGPATMPSAPFLPCEVSMDQGEVFVLD